VRPSVAGAAAAAAAAAAAGAAGTAAMVPSPFAAPHNNLKDWGRRMEAYKQVLQEDAADLTAKVRTCAVGCRLLGAVLDAQEGRRMCGARRGGCVRCDGRGGGLDSKWEREYG
jgi:hypothetical protein